MQLFRYLLVVICCLSHLSAQDKNQQSIDTAAKTVQAKQNIFNEQELAALDEMLRQQLGSTDAFAQSLYEHLTRQPGNNNALKAIEDMRELLQDFLYKQPSSVEDRLNRAHIMSAMCQHLYAGVCSNFNDWKPFVAPIKRTNTANISKKELLTQLDIAMRSTAAMINNTNQELPYLGLGTMRKSLRKSAEFLYKYTPPKEYLLTTAGISAIALWYIYSLDEKTSITPIENTFIRNALLKVKQFTGNQGKYEFDPNTGMSTLIGRSETGVLKKAEDMLNAIGIRDDKSSHRTNILLEAVKIFGLKKTGEYLFEKIKDKYNQTQGYIFGTPNGASVTNIKDVHVGFSEVIGNEVAKATLEPFIEYVIDPKKFNLNGSKPGNAILLTGETRTGKTHLAERIVGEINTRFKQRGELTKVNFIEIKAGFSRFLEENFGSVCNAIRYLMEHHAPCVIFIDEIHLLGLNQDKDPKMLSDFLTLLSGTDKINQEHPALIIAATNHPEQLDKALRQKGRFGTEIVLTYPQTEERSEFIIRKLKQSGIKADKHFIASFIHKTQGLAFEQIEELIRHQKQNAIISSTPITAESLDTAFNKVIYNIEEDADQLSDNDAMLTAIGISSQILAHDMVQKNKPKIGAMMQQPRRIIDRATILPINRRVKMADENGVDLKTIRCQGGIFSYLLNEQSGLLNETDLRNQIMVKLAAGIGQELVLQSRTLHAHDFNPDMYEAYQLCMKIVSRGLKLELLSKERQHDLKEQAYTLMNELENQVKELLKNQTQQIQLIAGILLMQRTLNQLEIAFLLEKPENAHLYLKEMLGDQVDLAALEKEMQDQTSAHIMQATQGA